MLTNRVFVEIIRTFYYKMGFLQLNQMLFVAKRSAISYKTQCYLLQNAVLSPTKRKSECINSQIWERLVNSKMMKTDLVYG